MIEANRLSRTIDGVDVVKNVTYAFSQPGIYGIIGPNGAGKTSLLRLLSGVDQPTDGEVRLSGKPIGSFAKKTLAKTMAVLQQGGLPAVGFSVRETVAMGRYPFQGWLGDEKEDPEPLIEAAIARMGLSHLQHRSMERLSGGERQRAALAQIMVQNPKVLLLDEPTTFLDIGYQMQLLETVLEWQREQGLLVVAVLHDLNLASLYCDHLLVIRDGTLHAAGKPASIITSELVQDVYGVQANIVHHPDGGAPQVVLRRPSADSSVEQINQMQTSYR